MKKKILIGVGVFAMILVIGFFYLNYRNRTLSPSGNVKYAKNNFSIEIPYSRPSKKGRLIFGTKEDGALLPHGVYWRLGANEATEISFDRDVLFNGEDVAAGNYRIYAVPGEHEFEISLNSEVSKWGYSDPDYSLDVLKTMIPVEKSSESVEQFTIRFEEDGSSVFVVCEWSDTKIKIPVKPK